MKPFACLVNTSRGGLVDDAALLQALHEGRLAGAGLDCVEDENSPVTKQLIETPNVLITPHVGGSTADLADTMVQEIVQNLRNIIDQRSVDHVVNIISILQQTKKALYLAERQTKDDLLIYCPIDIPFTV